MDGTGGLEVMSKIRIGSNVEEGGTFAGKISWSGRFRIEVGCKSCGFDMDGRDDVITISSAHVTILDKKVFGILREVRSVHDTDSRGAVSLERSRICLRISEQIQIRAVEFGMFYSMVEGVVFGVCGVDGDLGLLDVTDQEHWSGSMYSECNIGRGN